MGDDTNKTCTVCGNKAGEPEVHLALYGHTPVVSD
jgi:hypothetical protein